MAILVNIPGKNPLLEVNAIAKEHLGKGWSYNIIDLRKFTKQL